MSIPFLTITESKLVSNFRKERPDLKNGYVVVFDNTLTGWTSTTENPQGFAPGCKAISDNGLVFLATGGDEHNGAQRWDYLDLCPDLSTESVDKVDAE